MLPGRWETFSRNVSGTKEEGLEKWLDVVGTRSWINCTSCLWFNTLGLISDNIRLALVRDWREEGRIDSLDGEGECVKGDSDCLSNDSRLERGRTSKGLEVLVINLLCFSDSFSLCILWFSPCASFNFLVNHGYSCAWDRSCSRWVVFRNKAWTVLFKNGIILSWLCCWN